MSAEWIFFVVMISMTMIMLIIPGDAVADTRFGQRLGRAFAWLASILTRVTAAREARRG